MSLLDPVQLAQDTRSCLKEINNDHNNHVHGTKAHLNIERGSHAMLAAAQKENENRGKNNTRIDQLEIVDDIKKQGMFYI
jgi:hypothetical protein